MICRLCRGTGWLWTNLGADPCPSCHEPLEEDDVEPSDEPVFEAWDDLGGEG